jgi:hypothetical protein
MITLRQQYEKIAKVFNSFKAGKIVKKVKISDDDLQYSKLHYRHTKFENYTMENFISLVLYIQFTKNPVSLTDLLKILNECEKIDLLESIKFKNKILNHKNTLAQDRRIIDTIDSTDIRNVQNIYLNGKISLLGFYDFFLKDPALLKGRIAKKQFKNIKILLEFFDFDSEKIFKGE